MAQAVGQWTYRSQYRGARPLRRLSRQARRNRWLAMAVLALLTVLVIPFVARASGGQAEAPVLVTVRSGDTLWEIAGRFTPPGADRRPLIYEISRVNHLPAGGLIQPGQTLTIPGHAP